MLRPNHRSYYLYFEKQHRKSLLKYYELKLKMYASVRKLLAKDCTDRGYHFLFNQVKAFLESGLHSPRENKLDAYMRFIERTHPGIFDNFHIDLKHLISIEKQVHPWKLRYRADLIKQRSKIHGGRIHAGKLKHTLSPKQRVILQYN